MNTEPIPGETQSTLASDHSLDQSIEIMNELLDQIDTSTLPPPREQLKEI